MRQNIVVLAVEFCLVAKLAIAEPPATRSVAQAIALPGPLDAQHSARTPEPVKPTVAEWKHELKNGRIQATFQRSPVVHLQSSGFDLVETHFRL